MPLPSGTRLGAYEIAEQIGAGGMGEVYRARDCRLNRDVAVKLLPDSFASDSDRLRRFELEAQTAGGLNHPNILVVHDVGVDQGRPYLVSELLDGESLRERLRAGKLPLQKSIEYAKQAATGLSAAHARRIVHRDIKPENLFLTSDGRLKILDFGLAKVTAKGGRDESVTQTIATEPGSVMGTVGYMAPEQVRGKDLDHRADIFSLGCVLFEMATGTRAFHGESAADTMSAILTKDPLETLPPTVTLPAPLERIVRHCLEKSADERFQSARDLAFDLGSLSGTSPTALAPTGLPAAQLPRRWLRPLLAVALCSALVAAAFFGGMRTAQAPQARFERLTYRRGLIQEARFVPGGHTVVYAAAWNGGPIELFSTMPGNPESRPLGTPPGGLFSVSANGDVLVSLGARHSGSFLVVGTLAKAPLLGGVPREIREEVSSADYSHVTRELAVVPAFKSNESGALEYPPGKVLWKATGTGWPGNIRISPKGDLVAFADHYYFGDDGSVAVVDRAGEKKVLTERFTSLQGIAWSPSGQEIWFTGGKQGAGRALYAVTLAGKQRLVSSAPGTMTLHDIAADGRVLVSRDEYRTSIEFSGSEDSTPRDLSWMDWGSITFLSADGKTILIWESGEGARGANALFMRKTDGSPAVHIGDGLPGPLSPDGRWVISRVEDGSDVPPIRLLPARAGAERILDRGGIATRLGGFAWLPDSKRFAFSGHEKDRPDRCFLQSIDGGPPRPITPEGETLVLAMHDGSALLTNRGGGYWLRPLGEGEARPLPWKPEPGLLPIQTSLDGRWVYLQQKVGLVFTIFRVELTSGKRELWKVIKPSNPVAIRDVGRVLLTPDGKTYANRVVHDLGDLYLAEGLR
jgi:Tol biopolymer transport system component